MMAGTDDGLDDSEQLTEHLKAALDAEEMDEVNFHLRHALQLLGIRE